MTKNNYHQAGMVVPKLFRIAFAFALFVKAHRIALHSFRIRIALFAFSHFFHLFGQYFMVNAPKSCEKGEKMRKICKKKRCENAKKCKMQMRCEHGIKIRIASHYCNKKNSHFRIFSHRIRIALPSLPARLFFPFLGSVLLLAA